MKPKLIKNIKELKVKTSNGLEVFIMLGGGMIRSSKNIYWNGTDFEIFHEIDGTSENLTEKEILNDRKSNIGKAIRNNCLFLI